MAKTKIIQGKLTYLYLLTKTSKNGRLLFKRFYKSLRGIDSCELLRKINFWRNSLNDLVWYGSGGWKITKVPAISIKINGVSTLTPLSELKEETIYE